MTNKESNYQVTPFRSNDYFLDSARSLSDRRFSMFCLMRLLDETRRRTFQGNE